jgi:MinD-like ATPase involved in chromosome partitioning or flagellar assembly
LRQTSVSHYDSGFTVQVRKRICNRGEPALAHVFSIHSFRGGTGKSNATANLAVVFAQRGLRVGVVDTDIQSPGLHVVFGLKGSEVTHSLNDYLWGKATIAETAHPVLEGQLPGSIFLIPSSIRPDEIVQLLRQGYDMRKLTTEFRDLAAELNLDVLLIDTHPGLNEETLFSLAISTAVLIILRPDQQDFEGTGVTVDIARSLEVPRILLLVNKAPSDFDPVQMKATVSETFNCEVGGILAHDDEMLRLGSREAFVLHHPDHAITKTMNEVADRLYGA